MNSHNNWDEFYETKQNYFLTKYVVVDTYALVSIQLHD